MKALITQITNAFADVAYPGDDSLTNSFGDEAEALSLEFRGRTDWKHLDVEFLNQAPDGWGSALSFFSAKALQFYLPAYLIAEIEGRLTVADASTRLCAFVTPQMEDKKLAKVYGGGTLGEHARREFEIFTPDQVAAVVSYLKWKLSDGLYEPMIEQALDNYWLDRHARTNE